VLLLLLLLLLFLCCSSLSLPDQRDFSKIRSR